MDELFGKQKIEAPKTPKKEDPDEEQRRRDVSTARLLRSLDEGGAQQLRFSGAGIKVRK